MNEHATKKSALEAELKELKLELSKLGVQDPEDPDEWEVKIPDLDIMQADENEAADRSEEMQSNASILEELATRYKNVLHALKKIDAGTYGICEIGGEPIEETRLEANPAARTCLAHIGESEKLEG